MRKVAFKVFAEEFFTKRRAMVLSRELAPTSLLTDQFRFSKILPVFADKKICEITPHDADKFLDSLILQGKSPATRNRYRALLHTYFKHAVYTDRVRVNPITRIRTLSERLKIRKTGYWEKWEFIDRYIKAAFEFGGAAYGLGAALLCLGGGRIGEILSLDWEDVQWDRGLIRINKTLERHTNKVVERTKGQRAGGEYQMLMVPRLEAILDKHRMDSGFIVQNKMGRHLTYEPYRKRHYRIVTLAGLKRITLHDLRRTFASHAERAGFHKTEIGEMLGHETLIATEAYIRMDMSHICEKARRVGFGS